jgi:hypothetical protein
MTNTTNTINALAKRFRANANALAPRILAHRAASAPSSFETFNAEVEAERAAIAKRTGFDLGVQNAINAIVARHRRALQTSARALRASSKTFRTLANLFRRAAIDAETEGDAIALDRANTFRDACDNNDRVAFAALTNTTASA